MKCVGSPYGECSNPVKYIRHTQFSGSHPLCEEHATDDEGFLLHSSYTSWEVL